ncbi:MAG TPA: hypothetical protein VH478_09200 [Trebonia sp.]|nr:hypothetical protein [Trebonia sp.]
MTGGGPPPGGSAPTARAWFPGRGSRADLDQTVPLARDGGTMPFRAAGPVPADPRPGAQEAGGRATTRPEPLRPRLNYRAHPPQ